MSQADNDKGVTYGTHGDYLVARIARDRPDILERMKRGEYRSFRRAAIDAGIIKEIPEDDRRLHALLTAWRRADLVDRQLFLRLVDREIEAAYDGEYLSEVEKKPGPEKGQSFWVGDDCPADLHRLFEAGAKPLDVAEALEVSERTIMRWRLGQSKPRPKQAEALARLAENFQTKEDEE